MSVDAVKDVIEEAGLTHTVSPKSKHKGNKYTDEEILACIREAAEVLTDNFSHTTFDEYRSNRTFEDGREWPTHQTATLRFNKWSNACEKAEVIPGRTLRDNYSPRWTEEDCVAAVAAFVEYQWEQGGKATVGAYDQWQRGRDVPATATVRHRLDSWPLAVQRALPYVPYA